MSEINAAYSVLGDPASRMEYDSQRASHENDFDRPMEEGTEKAFSSAMDSTEARWSIAVGVYADLAHLRARLARISPKLSFSFVVTVLELKAFANREQIADRLELEFLQLYFGTSPMVVAYARRLLMEGHRTAARALNALVEVVGSDADPELLTRKVESEFPLARLREEAQRRSARLEHLNKLSQEVLLGLDFFAAKELARVSGFSVQEDGRLFRASIIHVTSPADTRTFRSPTDFTVWVQQELSKWQLAW